MKQALILFTVLLWIGFSRAQTNLFVVPGNDKVNLNGIDTFSLTWATKDFLWLEIGETVLLRDTSTKVDYRFKWSPECRLFYADKVKPCVILTVEVREGWVNRIWF